MLCSPAIINFILLEGLCTLIKILDMKLNSVNAHFIG